MEHSFRGANPQQPAVVKTSPGEEIFDRQSNNSTNSRLVGLGNTHFSIVTAR